MSGCTWSANRLPHTAHGDCPGLLAELAEGLQRLMDAQFLPRSDEDGRRERVAKALFDHLVGKSRGFSGYEWPAPEQHLPWWYAAADAAIAAYEGGES